MQNDVTHGGLHTCSKKIAVHGIQNQDNKGGKFVFISFQPNFDVRQHQAYFPVYVLGEFSLLIG